jgi:hypothetical protein
MVAGHRSLTADAVGMASIMVRLYQVTDTSPRQAMPVVVYTLAGVILLLAALLLSIATTLLSIPGAPDIGFRAIV